MAIFSGPRWPNQAIPYVVTRGDAAKVTAWINRLNKRLRRTLFIPHLSIYAGLPSVPANTYVSIEYIPGTPESEGVVGYKGSHEHRVKCADEARLIHELFHVLGFQHEQYHPKYGWIGSQGWPDDNRVSDHTLEAVPSESSWNDLLCDCMNKERGAGGTSGNSEFLKWAAHNFYKHEPWTVDDQNMCDIWSAMMYITCRKALLKMRQLLRQARTNVGWSQMQLNKNLLNCEQGQQWLAPLTPADQRYNLSQRDAQDIRNHCGQVNPELGKRARAKWTNLTDRKGHLRSGDLVKVDKALESIDLDRIKNTFNHWYNNNTKERTKRNKDDCVEKLRTSLSRF